jgi:hypothetical protein
MLRAVLIAHLLCFDVVGHVARVRDAALEVARAGEAR